MKFRRSAGPPKGEMPFLDHLEELRWRILWALLALGVGVGIGFFVVMEFDVLGLLIAPIEPLLGTQKLKYLSPTDPFFITLRVALILGILLAAPVIIYQIWAFVSPALMPREKRAIVPSLYLGLVLFLAGVALAYFVALPTTLRFMMGFQTGSLEQNIVIGAYASFVIRLLLAFGLVFELPVVILVLAAIGVVDSRMLSAGRRYALVAITIVASVITPGDFIVLTLFLMIPLMLLYELSIGLAKLVERRRESAQDAAANAAGGASWVVAALLAAGLSAGAAPAVAQEPAPDSARAKVVERMRLLRPIVERPGQAGGPSDSVRPRPDTAAVRGRPPGEGRSGPAAPAAPAIQRDSIMGALLELEGFAATEYAGTGAHYGAAAGSIELTGPAQVARAGNSMTADSLLTYDFERSVACGYGNPVLIGEGAGAPVQSDQVCFDVDRELGIAIGARTEFSQGGNWFIHGDRLYTSGQDRIYGRHTSFTSCDLAVPHYHFKAREVKVVADRVLVARDVTLNFGDVPVFWLPFMMQSMERGRRSGVLMPRFGVNDIARTSSGYNRRISDLGFYWAINEYMGARVAMEWYSQHWTALQGSFDFRWLDRFLDGRMTFNRYWRADGATELTLNGGTSWEMDERTRLSASANYASSSSFVRRNSFDPRELRRNNIESNGSLNRRFDWGTLGAGVSRRQYLSDGRTDYTLPRLSLNLAPVTLLTAPSSTASWYNNATWSGSATAAWTGSDVADTLATQDSRHADLALSSRLSLGQLSWSQSVSTQQVVLAERTGLEPDTALPRRETRGLSWSTSLNYQQRLVGTSTITPQLSWSGQMERSPETGGEMLARPSRFDFGASLNTDLYGFWPGVGPFSRIRHRFSPNIRYGFSPAATATPLQNEVFGSTTLREQNAVTISLSQTLEAKYAKSDTAMVAESDTAGSATGEPRRLPQARKAQLLSLTTSAVAYDWVAAREEGRGFRTDQISHSVTSDLLRGLQLSFTHDLFEGDGDDRDFAPRLTSLNANFRLDQNSWIFDMFGLGRDEPADSVPATAAEAEAEMSEDDSSMGLLGSRPVPRQPQRGYTRGGVGNWNASFRYTLARPRVAALAPGTPLTGQPRLGGANQMLHATVDYQPTINWSLHWTTGYSFDEESFTDHVLTLSRDLHRWQANFDFFKAQNGNFTFQFRVTLTDNPDLKLEYEQREERGLR